MNNKKGDDGRREMQSVMWIQGNHERKRKNDEMILSRDKDNFYDNELWPKKDDKKK